MALFLIYMCCSDGSSTHSFYRKPTHSYRYLNAQSHHKPAQKNYFKNYFKKLLPYPNLIPYSKSYFMFQLHWIPNPAYYKPTPICILNTTYPNHKPLFFNPVHIYPIFKMLSTVSIKICPNTKSKPIEKLIPNFIYK